MLKYAAVVLLYLIVFTCPAESIVRRHDRDEAAYVALGNPYGDVVGDLGGRVACTLIDPRWALGAAHTIEDYFSPGRLPVVSFGGREYQIDKVIIHPRRVRGAVDSSTDLVLLRLSEPVSGVTPVSLYERDDEMGQVITMVGRGHTGTGLDRVCDTGIGDRGVLQGAQNRVEASFEGSLIFTFDVPPDGLDLEGISGGGDSGCPALLEQDGTLYILGVGAFNTGSAEDSTACGYGTIDAFARVSVHRPWILETIAADPPSSLPFYLQYSPANREDLLPKTAAAMAAGALLKAFNTGTLEAMADFYRAHGKPRPEEEIMKVAGQWPPLMEEYGRYELRGFAEEGPDDIAVFVYATQPGIGRVISVRVDPATGNRVARMRMADSELSASTAK